MERSHSGRVRYLGKVVHSQGYREWGLPVAIRKETFQCKLCLQSWNFGIAKRDRIAFYVKNRCYNYCCGEMAEWLKAHAWKACVWVKSYRRFESCSLRQSKKRPFGRFLDCADRIWTLRYFCAAKTAEFGVANEAKKCLHFFCKWAEKQSAILFSPPSSYSVIIYGAIIYLGGLKYEKIMRM